MNILNKFTLKSLSKNKKRTIVTIIGVALSTALICAVAGMLMSVKKTLVETTKLSDGNFHIRFENVPKNELKYIENNKNVTDYFYSRELGYSYLKGSQNENKPYLYVLGLDDVALENSGLKLTQGRMPENENEIVFSNHIITNGRVEFKLGDTVTLDIGKRIGLDGAILKQNNPYQSEDDTEVVADTNTGETIETNDSQKIYEQIIDTVSKTYTIVGFIERPSYSTMEEFSSPGYTVITRLSKEQIKQAEDANISVFLKNPGNREEEKNFISSIINTIEENTGKSISAVENAEILRFEGNLGENSLVALYWIVGIVIAIIVVSSVFVIRNSFSISVSEKTKQYGMMASIGATSKQIRKSVLFEALFIGAIGIPLGIVCGIIAVAILVWLLNFLMEDLLNGIKFLYGIPLEAILITCITSSVTIFLSAIIPAIKASRITPIEAIRENNDIKIKAKKIKTSKLTKKIFGIGGVIASKNLKRSKKKYRTTVISLVVSITVFIALSSFLQDGLKMTGYYYTDYEYNISIFKNTSRSTKEANKDKIELYQEIIRDFDLSDYSYSYEGNAQIDLNKYASKENKEYIQKNRKEEDYTFFPEEKSLDYIGIVKLEKNYFKRYLQELGVKESDDAVVLTDEFMYGTQDNPNRVISLYNIKDGDEIEISTEEGTKKLTISKVAEKPPMGYYNSSSQGHIFVSEDSDLLSNDICYLQRLIINAKEPNKLEASLLDRVKEDVRYSDVSISNIEANLQAEKRVILIISIFLYGFIGVITLIGVTNIFNTITTNMILRSKEFAMLKSIGMTKKEFDRMIVLESIMYGTKSLIIGIPLGIGLAYAIYRSYALNIEFGFMFPATPILISILFVFIIVGLTMKYSLNKINKQNIVETIRNDNI